MELATLTSVFPGSEGSKRMKPEKQVTDAVEKAQAISADYLHPGSRDCNVTVKKLLNVLGSGSLTKAVDEVKDGRTEKQRRKGLTILVQRLKFSARPAQ